MTETGIWSQKEADLYHKSSPKLARFLAEYLDINLPVYDFGCGQGYYLYELASIGFRCLGIEGFKLNNFLHDNILIHDLTKPIVFIEPVHGQVLSFETGEHLPKSAEHTFLNSITDTCKTKLIMSWATIGQPGVGHINCQNHDYIIKQVEIRGFKLNEPDTLEIRKNVDPECDWLERNLLIFDRV
jgi:hypothetical protein